MTRLRATRLRATRFRATRLILGGALLTCAAGYAWALRADHAFAPVLSVGTGILLAGTLLSLRSSGRKQWTREPDPELPLLRRELSATKQTVAELEEQLRSAADVPRDLAGAVAQMELLQAELAESKRLLHDARSDSPSLEELLEAAWHPGEGRRSPQDEADLARLRDALQSSERELRRAREEMMTLAEEDPARLDEKVRELQESLQRSEAERALLRAGRPETVWEARVRELERRLRTAEAKASAIGSLSDGADEMIARLERAVAGRLAAEDRARQAEERAIGVEIRARELAREVKTRFAEAEKSWQATATGELERLRKELEESAEQLRAAEERAEETAARADAVRSGVGTGASAPDPTVLAALEARVEEAERRAREAELLLHEITQTDEERASSEASELRSRLSKVTGQRKAGSTPTRPSRLPPPDTGPLDDLREAVAYELRVPVASLRGLALALKGAVATADGRDLVRQLGTTVRRIDQLVADLASAAKLAEGSVRLRRRRTELTSLVTRVVEEADGFENRVMLLDGEPLSLSVDPIRVEQIVTSLLANARGRTTKGQTISVHVGSTDDGAALISINDDGRGKPNIGAELSLAIRLAEAHGGRLWVEPLAKGASFRVELRPATAGAASEESA